MYTATCLVHGFPAKSASHGGFGWSSLWLFQDGDRRVLIDAGPPSYVPVIHERLRAIELTADDVSDVVVTHLHWDHVSNFTMYRNATTWVGEVELEWAVRLPAGTPFVPDLHVRELVRRSDRSDRGDRVRRVRPGDGPLPGMTAIASAGHTPGHLAFAIETVRGPVICAGDAVKNLHELHAVDADSTMDAAASRRSIERLRSLLRDTDGLLIPGHDVPLRVDGTGFARVRPQGARIGFFDSADGEADRSIGDAAVGRVELEDA